MVVVAVAAVVVVVAAVAVAVVVVVVVVVVVAILLGMCGVCKSLCYSHSRLSGSTVFTEPVLDESGPIQAANAD